MCAKKLKLELKLCADVLMMATGRSVETQFVRSAGRRTDTEASEGH